MQKIKIQPLEVGAQGNFCTIDAAGFCAPWDLDTEETALVKPSILKEPAEQAHQTMI